MYRTSSVYDYACIYQGSSPVASDCGPELSSITKDIEYTLSWISTDGKEAIISGGLRENVGVLGTDPAGIIVGKSQPVGNAQQVTIELAYRSLRDAAGRTYKTYIFCETGCRAGTGIKRLTIERTNIERTSNSTNYYITLRFE